MDQLTAGLWVVPALLTAAAIPSRSSRSRSTTPTAFPTLGQFDSAFAVGPEGARLVLSTIAGSIIIVASLVFSITVVTLTLASSQLGPRLITPFMRDRITQVALGTFIATFLFALIVLQTVTEGQAEPLCRTSRSRWLCR